MDLPALRRRVVRGLLANVLIQAAFLFLAAGRVDWLMAWVYLAMNVLVMAGEVVWLLRVSPNLVRERVTAWKRPDVKGWDRWIVVVMAVAGPLTILLVAGLDQRFGWSAVGPLWLQLAMLTPALAGHGLVMWAMRANPFFSALVRIQAERGHRVITGGPYRHVRHPGYSGAILWYLATPLILGSLWALVPAVLTVAVTVLRTVLEDRTLFRELDGYPGYARQVRWRLLPGLW
ncbi:MAG: isoprenylcysteine carboxylmethyltransferase family protein [Alphaproteobacteria bacterium]|nr:isoprenylcysteine carboxylmethyltransferase family protein [Alphaproteobacteria bacterium]